MIALGFLLLTIVVLNAVLCMNTKQDPVTKVLVVGMDGLLVWYILWSMNAVVGLSS